MAMSNYREVCIATISACSHRNAGVVMLVNPRMVEAHEDRASPGLLCLWFGECESSAGRVWGTHCMGGGSYGIWAASPEVSTSADACAQALFGDADEGTKLADRAQAHKALLAALAADPASQMAQLLGLEFLLGETLPARVKEVP